MDTDITAIRLSEANHRIANSLAAIAGLVRIQASDDDRVQQLRSPHEVRTFLNEISTRIDTAAQLHRLLSHAKEERLLDLPGYLMGVSKAVVATHGRTDNVSLIYELGPHCPIPASDALSVGMIVAELITNSLKYAHPTGVRGQILFSCRRTSRETIVEVSDDGIGLPQDFDPETAFSLGLKLIRTMAKQIGATFSLRDEGLGVRAVLRIPVREAMPSTMAGG